MPGVVSADQTLPQEGRKGQGSVPRGSWRHGPLLDQRREVRLFGEQCRPIRCGRSVRNRHQAARAPGGGFRVVRGSFLAERIEKKCWHCLPRKEFDRYA
jgi:hypothetical protein